MLESIKTFSIILYDELIKKNVNQQNNEKANVK